MNHYNHKDVELRWQNYWNREKPFRANDFSKKPKFYCLDMFPYPSGAGLHVGHPLGYTATDIVCRKKRHEGYEVLHPIGWDAFGLPAENYAIKTGTNPRITTQKNIETFKRQIQSLGFSYDWDREINTTDPEYYRWTQWLFLQMHKKGLLYEKEMAMAWCDTCKIVAANEEVEQGTHERCGNPVTRKKLKQWMFRITDYAERLLRDLDSPTVFLLHGWGGDGENHWFGEMKSFFESRGSQVIAPDFPDTQTPDYQTWKSFFKEHYGSLIHENTVFITHSLGGVFASRYIAEEKVCIDKLVLTAPPLHDCGVQEISNFFQEQTWSQSVIHYTKRRVLFGSSNDHFIEESEFHTLAKKLDAELVIVPHAGHFNTILEPELKSYREYIDASRLRWPEKIRSMQKHWIGKSEGAEIQFDIEGESITVFTTRPDTIYGVTYMVLAPEHPLVSRITTKQQKEEVESYQVLCASKSDLERTELNKNKTGVFTGAYAIHPLTDEKIPVWIADYVLLSYGTGAVMAVPAHDERDYEFAKTYDLGIKQVVQSEENNELPFCENGIACNSEFLDGLETTKAKTVLVDYLQTHNKGKRRVNYRLRDWIFTRQRYWGEPIPFVRDEKGNLYPLDEKELPVKLPDVQAYEPSSDGTSPLASQKDWVEIQGWITPENTVSTTEVIGSKPQKFFRETSTMPNWAGSSWYWIRYMDSRNEQEFCSKEKESYWGPVDLYVGGTEHAVLHLLYARFWQKVLYDMELVHHKEPFQKLINQGLILGEDGNKMSKSLGNVVNPDDIVSQYGADTLRMYEMFMGPFDQSKPWNTESVSGMRKFIDRIWRLAHKPISEKNEPDSLIALRHKTIALVGEHIDDFRFNTALSQLMIYVNEYTKQDSISREALEVFCVLLSPFAPHIAEELWQTVLGHSNSIAYASWPSYTESYLVDDSVIYAVQVNGKVRDTIEVGRDTPRETVIDMAKSSEKIRKYIEGKTLKKEVFVPEKIVGFVVA